MELGTSWLPNYGVALLRFLCKGSSVHALGFYILGGDAFYM